MKGGREKANARVILRKESKKGVNLRSWKKGVK